MKIKFLASGLSLFMLLNSTGLVSPNLFSTSQNAMAIENIVGDINGDGYTTNEDLKLLQKYILNKTTDIQNSADINNDGLINSLDLVYLKQIISDNELSNYSALKINEICASNKTGIVDAYGQNSDWIEIYNSSDKEISLKDIGLSDGTKNAFKFVFPDISIPANDYVIVFATAGFPTINDELHADFGISKAGESIYLTHPNYGLIDSLSMPAIDSDLTYGRFTDGSDNLITLKPTPNQANEKYSAVSAPIFSFESGFYDNSINLDITYDSGTTVYYTTDGSIPTVDDNVYNNSLSIVNRTHEPNYFSANTTAAFPGSGSYYIPKVNVTKSTIIRAIAVDSDGNCSDIVTGTYFIGIDQANQYNNLPVVSIAIDEEDLFDYNTGIYTTGVYFNNYLANGGNPKADEWTMDANFTQSGCEWEKAIQMDFFESDGSLGFSETLGMRIQGGASRANPQKSLKFFSRSEYGSSKLNYNLIPGLVDANGKNIEKFDTFILRNSANDMHATKFRDPFIHELVKDRNLETQSGRPVIAFINGEYWGIYQLQEDYNDKYINHTYGIDEDQVIMIKCGWELEEGSQGDSDFALYTDLINFVRNTDLSKTENYNKYCEIVDIQSLADYFATQIYINNQDVFANGYVNNYRMWRTRDSVDGIKNADGKWRWILYDTEFSSDVYGVSKLNDLDALINALLDNSDAVVFSKPFKENSEFRELFLNTIMDLGNVNFSKQNYQPIFDKYVSLYKPAIREWASRFGPEWIVKYHDPDNYYSNQVYSIFGSFMSNRLNNMISGLQNKVGASNTADVTLSLNKNNAGYIQINTVTPDLSAGNWTGKYFTECDITLTAIPAEGYTFTGWSGYSDSTDSTITISFSDAIRLQANFN